MVRKDHYSTTAKKKGLMSFVVGVGILKPELVLLAKTRIVVARATQGSDFGTEGYPDASNACGNEAVIILHVFI